MRTWIPCRTIGTAIIARDRLDQLLQTALIADLLALIDVGHVCDFGLRMRGPLEVLQSFACRRGRRPWWSQGSGAEDEAGRGVVCSGQLINIFIARVLVGESDSG